MLQAAYNRALAPAARPLAPSFPATVVLFPSPTGQPVYRDQHEHPTSPNSIPNSQIQPAPKSHILHRSRIQVLWWVSRGNKPTGFQQDSNPSGNVPRPAKLEPDDTVLKKEKELTIPNNPLPTKYQKPP